MSRVFLSHSSRDDRQALALQAWLVEAEPGLASEIFLDRDRETGIATGTRWKDALRLANERCEAVICLLSRHWDDSHECKTEYRSAEDRGKPIFPVRLEPASGHDITQEWQRCDLYGPGPKTTIRLNGDAEPVEFLTEGLLLLQRGLRAAGIAPDSFTWPPPGDPDRSPYRGWQPHEDADAAVYFGRDAQINRALMAIRGMRASGEDRLFVILGPSGTGKSSFLRAGLLPRLRRDDRHFLPMPVIRPERHPITGPYGLAASIHGLRSALGLPGPALGMIKAGVIDPTLTRQWLIEAQQIASSRLLDVSDVMPPTLVLALDQAEELFVADADQQCGQFRSALTSLLTATSLPIIAVATIRSDSYEPLQTAPELAVIGTKPFDDLKPMPTAQFREVICGPAERANKAGDPVSWSPELIDRLVRDCGRGADTLPLLSLTLARLYTDFGGGEIGLPEYETLGGLRRVVQTEIDDVLSSNPDERTRQLDRLRTAFIPWLATVNPDSDLPMRRVARWSDLPADSHPLLGALVDKRLLVKDERDGDVVVEVALESLLRQWDELAGWLVAEADDLKDADSIEHAASLWNHSERHEDWLLEGTRLADAEALAARPGYRDRLNVAREYLLASRQREDRRAHALVRRVRVLRAALALVAVIALVATVAGIWAFRAQRTANAQLRDKVAQSLLANAQEMLMDVWPGDGSDTLAIQMVLAARNFPSQYQYADYYALGALHQERDLVKIIDQPSVAAKVAFSPDGNTILTGNFGGTVRQFDTRSGEPKGPALEGHSIDVYSVAYSPDGTRIASGDGHGDIRLWDAATGKAIGGPLTGHDLAITGLAFSPDGRTLVSGSADQTLLTWDTATGQQRGEPIRAGDNVTGLAISPDGRTIAAGLTDNTVRVWDLETRQPVGEPLRGHDGWVMSVAFSPDGRMIASGSGDRTIRIWDAVTRRPVGEPIRGHDQAVFSVAFSPDGARIASGSGDRTIRIWDVASHRQVGLLTGHRSAVDSVAFHPDGRLVVSGSDDHSVRLWDSASWQPVDTGVQEMALANFVDGGRAIGIGLGGSAPSVRFFETATGAPLGPPIRVPNADVESVVALDRHRLESLDSANRIQFWDARAGLMIGKPIMLRNPDKGQRFDYGPATHRFVLAPTRTRFEVFDVTSMKAVGPAITTQSQALAFMLSPDGRVLATGHPDWTLRLWNVRTGEPIGEPMKTDGWVDQLRFSEDSRLVAAADHGAHVRVWDVATHREVGPTMTGDALISFMDISPDNSTLAIGTGDGHIQLFDIRSGVQFGPAWIGHTDVVTSLDFNPDGSRLLSAGADGTVRMWPVPKLDTEALCAKITQNMSRADWDFWVSTDIQYVKTCPDLPVAGEAE